MRNWFFLIIAALLVGFGIFAAMYWLAGSNWQTSFTIALSAGIAGVVGELMRAYFERKRRKRNKNN